MTQQQNPFTQPRALAPVVPLHGDRDRVPSPVRVRGRLEGRDRTTVRAAVAAALALGERAAGDPDAEQWAGWDAPVRLDPLELSERTGLPASEVEAGVRALAEGGVLSAVDGADGRVWLDPEVLAELPSLAGVAWPRVRARLQQADASWAPALAAYAELALQGGAPADRPARWVQSTVSLLAESLGYGRTATTQALALLERAGLLERASQPARRALRLRLLPLAGERGRALPPARAALPAPPHSATPAPSNGADGLTVVVNGVSLVLGAGSRLDVGDGAAVTLERGPDGLLRAVVR